MTGPIRPDQVDKVVAKAIPSGVFEVFNDLIARRWTGSSAVVYQDEALELIKKRLRITSEEVVNRGLLDVESSYRAVGWHVVYDSPVAYAGETYRANFKFTKDKT